MGGFLNETAHSYQSTRLPTGVRGCFVQASVWRQPSTTKHEMTANARDRASSSRGPVTTSDMPWTLRQSTQTPTIGGPFSAIVSLSVLWPPYQ